MTFTTSLGCIFCMIPLTRLSKLLLSMKSVIFFLSLRIRASKLLSPLSPELRERLAEEACCRLSFLRSGEELEELLLRRLPRSSPLFALPASALLSCPLPLSSSRSSSAKRPNGSAASLSSDMQTRLKRAQRQGVSK